jgi:hypothetical protein
MGVDARVAGTDQRDVLAGRPVRGRSDTALLHRKRCGFSGTAGRPKDQYTIMYGGSSASAFRAGHFGCTPRAACQGDTYDRKKATTM